jgi:hypothetical protein
LPHRPQLRPRPGLHVLHIAGALRTGYGPGVVPVHGDGDAHVHVPRRTWPAARTRPASPFR